MEFIVYNYKNEIKNVIWFKSRLDTVEENIIEIEDRSNTDWDTERKMKNQKIVNDV